MATSTKNSTIYRTNILIFTEKYCILTEKSEQICYLKAHTQSCLWTLMTLTVPSFSFIGFQNSFHSWCFYWDLRKMLKMKRRRKLFLASKDHLPLVKLFVLSIFLSIQFILGNLSPTWSIFSAMQIFLHLVIFNHFAVGWIPAASGIYRSILCSLDLPWESTREGTLLIYGSQFDLFFCIFLPINFYQIQIQIVLANTKYIQFGFLPKFVGFFLFLVELFTISDFFWICSWDCVDFCPVFFGIYS